MDKLTYLAKLKEVPLSSNCMDAVVIMEEYIKHLEAVNKNYADTIMKLRSKVKSNTTLLAYSTWRANL